MTFNYETLSKILDHSEELHERPLAHMLKALQAIVEETESQRREIEKLKSEIVTLKKLEDS